MQSSQVTFITLPREIRNRIYHFVIRNELHVKDRRPPGALPLDFADDAPSKSHKGYTTLNLRDFKPPRSLAICREIYHEYVEYACTEVTFCVIMATDPFGDTDSMPIPAARIKELLGEESGESDGAEENLGTALMDQAVTIGEQGCGAVGALTCGAETDSFSDDGYIPVSSLLLCIRGSQGWKAQIRVQINESKHCALSYRYTRDADHGSRNHIAHMVSQVRAIMQGRLDAQTTMVLNAASIQALVHQLKDEDGSSFTDALW